MQERFESSPKSIRNDRIGLGYHRGIDDGHSRSTWSRCDRFNRNRTFVGDAELWYLLRRSNGGGWDSTVLLRLPVSSDTILTG
jgi:hypothetical protein